MLVHWIWLSLLNIEHAQKLALLHRFRDPEQICNASEEAFDDMAVDADTLGDRDLTRARQIAAQCAQKRIGILTYGDAAYPHRLKNVEEPPLVLYYKGVLPEWESVPVIGVVGTRKASSYGLQMAKRLGCQVAACGALLISGGALGIDAEAMSGALQIGKPVVAVLGCGVDILYPKRNEALLMKTQELGCLLSEYPPGTPAYSWNFPRRNRIVSGISSGVLVVEAPEKSGALITARYALDQGRDVFVVPGNINVASCAGSNLLLRERATPIFSGWDAVKEYKDMYPGKLSNQDSAFREETAVPVEKSPEQKQPLPSKHDKKSVDNPGKSHYSVLNNVLGTLTEEERQILAYLTPAPQPVDEVLAKIPLPAGKVLSMLTVLALKGVVENHPGKRISVK